MGPNGTPEQNPPEKSQAQQAKEAADQIIQQIRDSLKSDLIQINSETDADKRTKMREELAQKYSNEIQTKLRLLAASEPSVAVSGESEDKKEKVKDAKKTFLEIKELQKEGINIVNPTSQAMVDKIVEQIKSGEIADSGVLAIERILGKQLIDGVVFSKPGEQLSATEQGLKDLYKVDHLTGQQIIANVALNPETFGIDKEDFLKKLDLKPPEIEGQRQPTQREMSELEMEAQKFQGDYQYYQSRFTQDQLQVISTFYAPEQFIDFMEKMESGDDSGDANFLKKNEVQERKQDIEHHIRDYYDKNSSALNGRDLETVVKDDLEKHWGEEVSEMMAWKVSDVINQIFLELQQKSPHKFYEEIMQGDPFYGPLAIQNKIQTAINSLMTKVGQIERDKDNPLYKKLETLKKHLYRHTADKPYIDERDGKKYPRLKPLPFGERVDTSDFIQFLGSTVDHTIHKAEYFHNSRAIYGHPAGEKGFYNQLGGFAESLKGTDIDEIMMLPDGQYIMQAYQLYEKYLEEDFASLDWRHRPDQFQNQLERVNSKLEIEVFEQLKSFYPNLTKERVRNIVNAAVGISRGVFLTEPEKSAYADPVDAEGRGMVASYSTNDAQSLNVFNPLHNALRWQGEHNWNMMYFMPVEGQPGKAWDHKKAWDNMAKYMDSFIAGKGRDKEELPDLFADVMLDINQLGGPNKRKGWRMDYSYDGHYVYDDDNTINAPKTFRAMEAIGYEAIAHMLSTDKMWVKLLEATDKTAKGREDVAERTELFSYIYQRYFSADPTKFQESDLTNYLTSLRGKAEKNAMDKIKKTGSLEQETWDAQIAYETSKLFLENTKAHYVASRMPTKFLRIDRNRYTKDGVSRWERIQKELKADKGWDLAEFDMIMKDLTMAEMLLRREISDQIRKQMSFDKHWSLHDIDKMSDLPFKLDEGVIRRLLAKDSKNKVAYKSEEEIQKVVDLWKHINKDFNNNAFLDGEGAAKIKEYKFTFGLEDTDISLIPYRGTGPRMIARAIKDIGGIEATVTPWLLNMPNILSEIAISGKHDFGPIIEYLVKAKKAINDVHGSEAAQEFVYKVSGAIINYFKIDARAKGIWGLFGLRKMGQRNSMAAEYAGRSTAVWEWDSREIDRYCTALESYRLIPLNPYDANLTKRAELKDGKWVEHGYVGGKMEDRWIKLPFLKKPIKFGKKRHIDFEFNGAKLRKEHGADWKAITFDYINQFLPLALAFLLWKYIKDAMDEASGKKKQ